MTTAEPPSAIAQCEICSGTKELPHHYVKCIVHLKDLLRRYREHVFGYSTGTTLELGHETDFLDIEYEEDMVDAVEAAFIRKLSADHLAKLEGVK